MDGGQNALVTFLPLILIFVVFYFLLIRPQQKRMKEHRAMLQSLRRGDRIVTGGGIIGTITRAGDEELTIEIADGVRVKVLRATVNTVLAKPEPARSRDDDDEDDEEDEDEDDAADTRSSAPRGRSRASSLLSKRR